MRLPFSRRTRLVLGVAMGVLAQLAAIGLLLTSAWLIVRAAQHPPVLFLMIAIVSVRFFGIARSVFRYLERLFTHDVALGDAVEQRVEAYQRLDAAAPQGLDSTRRGDVVSRVVGDVATMQDRLLRVLVPWWVGVAAATVVALVVAGCDLFSGFVVAAGVVVTAVSIRWFVGSLTAARLAGTAHARGALAAEVSELVLAAADIVAAGAQVPAQATARQATGKLDEIQRRGGWIAGLGSAIVLAITGVTVAVLAASSAGIPPVLVGVVLLAPVGLVETLDMWSDAERHRPTVRAAERRLAALAELPEPVTDPAEPAELPSSFELRLDEVQVGWSGVATAPISAVVAPGEAIAVTGPSGVGKSTLAYTIICLLEPRGGSITLGGTDITRLRAADVRSVIGYLGQDDTVFNTSIRENLRIARPDATDTEFEAALAGAGLSDFVATLPRGLDTMVGEHGGELSGGERQRLCLARLLLGEHRILVVDEPTEHLDAPTAQALMDDLVALMPHRSLVVISHSAAVVDRFATVIHLAPSGASPAVQTA